MSGRGEPAPAEWSVAEEFRRALRYLSRPAPAADDGALVPIGAIACLTLLSLAFLAQLGLGVSILYAFPVALACWLFGRWVGLAFTAGALVAMVTAEVATSQGLARLAVTMPALVLVTLVSIVASERAAGSEALMDELRERGYRHRRMLETMTDVSRELVESKRWEAIAEHLTESLRRDLELDAAWMFLRYSTEAGDRLELLAGAGDRPSSADSVLSQGSLAEVVAQGVPLVAGSALELAAVRPDLVPAVVEDGLEARMVMPVFVKGAVAGVLMLASRARREWSDEERRIAAAVTSQLGLAMENASAYRSTVEALVQLEEVIQMKSDFLKTVSHELRTPITVMAGYIDLMADGSLGEVPQSWRMPMEQVKLKVSELNQIVRMMLDASRAEGPSISLHLADIDLGTTVRLAVEAQVVEARRRGRRLRLEPPAQPVRAVADQDKLLVVLRNLIENAVKYSPAESVVDIGYQGDADRVSLWVADRGPGIPDGDKPRIFDQFYRVDHPDLRDVGGTGLGLFICKQLVEAQGGRIAVADRPGGGSVFSVAIPRRPEASAPEPNAAPEPDLAPVTAI
ncbi:MAG TPA: ATP-binding protein [Candidatus Dormibacteraeota bacterium]|jgi:signal transduction histidine kinase|nr:ATP-binding protein [Candidatus Dormibacteraeota bacterium]